MSSGPADANAEGEMIEDAWRAAELFGDRGLVFREVEAERERQDTQWGGPTHDDEHAPEDWIDFMRIMLDDADEVIGCPEDEQPEIGPDAEYRRRLVQVAALAIAAIESLDRIKSRK